MENIKKDSPKENQKIAEIKLNLLPEMRHGVYANHMVVQFVTPFEFQLNFVYLFSSSPGEPGVEADIVAKINIPASLMPNLIRALDGNFQNFLARTKEIETKQENTDE